jgi:hypothetical protein
MAGETGTDVELTVTMQDTVRATALKALYAKSNAMKAVMNVTKDIPDGSDRVSIPIWPSLTTFAITEETGQINSGQGAAITFTAPEVTVNNWRGVPAEFTMRGLKQSKVELLKGFATESGRALAAYIDTTVFALQSSLTSYTDAGSSATPLNDALLRSMKANLDNADVGEENRSWVIHTVGNLQLLGDPRFSEAQNTGFSKGLQVDQGRTKVTFLYGHPVVVSTTVAEASSAKKNLLIHEECIGLAVQKNFKIHESSGLPNFKLTEIRVAEVLFGTAVVRATHGVVGSSSTTV